jgi:formylglycine-generating enzyme required for sulfatase activity
MATKIFLAHGSEDKPRVRNLYRDLKARGFDPWLDEEDLEPGQIWPVEIPKAIHQAGVFLACLSSQSVGRVGFVQNEFRIALSAVGSRPSGTTFLIPVRLDECNVPDLQIPDLGLSLRDIHWVNLWQEGGFDRLVRALEKALVKFNEAQRLSAEKVSLPLGIAPDQAPAVTVLRDVSEPWCPELVVIPPGKFMMGSTEPERRWAMEQGALREEVDWERPQHQVAIPKALAVGKHPVTRGQFAAFVEATAHDMSGSCWVFADRGWEKSSSTDWCSPGFEQTDDHPVVCLNWEDARSYVAWLNRQTDQPYRLLSEAEWEYAARAGTTTRYSWGNEITSENANYGRNVGKTTEVGSYPPNPWGLCDMHGNVWEWVEDCWNESYQGAPNDGSAWTSGDCRRRVLRGSTWSNGPQDLRSALRYKNGSDGRSYLAGFRVARTLR